MTHLYVNGEVCDVTGEPRQARVKYRLELLRKEGRERERKHPLYIGYVSNVISFSYRCAKKLKSLNQIAISLDEPSPCNYVITVSDIITMSLTTFSML